MGEIPSWWPSNKPWIIGDCIEVMKDLPDESVDLVVTDPPYGVDYSSKNEYLNEADGGNRIEEEIDGDISVDSAKELWYNAFKELEMVMKPGAVIYCHMPQGGDQMMMMMMMMDKAGIEPRHELIWLKNNHVLGRVDYAYIHEPILYAWKDGGHDFYGGFKRSVLKYDKPLKSKKHPTMKPVELTKELIINSSKEKEIVFDPFLGSGTTLKACRMTDRIGLGCEINPEYEDVIKKRSMNNIRRIEEYEK